MLFAVAASLAGAFPIAPRLILFAFPALIVLAVAGVGGALERLGPAAHRVGLVAAIVLVVLPLELASVVRTLALEPPGYFAQLVRDVKRERKPSEPVYVFARSLPAWIYYSTDWAAPDTARLHYLVGLAGAGGAGFENTPARGRVRERDLDGLSYTRGGAVELLGLPSGMEWREVEGHVGRASRQRLGRAGGRPDRAGGVAGGLGAGFDVLRAGDRAVRAARARRGPAHVGENSGRLGAGALRVPAGPGAGAAAVSTGGHHPFLESAASWRLSARRARR